MLRLLSKCRSNQIPVLESLFNKVASLKAYNFIKKTPTQVLSCEICQIFRNTYFEEHLGTTASANAYKFQIFIKIRTFL